MTHRGANVVVAVCSSFKGKRHGCYKRTKEVIERRNEAMREFRKKYPLR